MFDNQAFALKLARLSDEEFMRYLEELPSDASHLNAQESLLLGEAVRMIFELPSFRQRSPNLSSPK